nr:unnamed protein product [Callosobruchus chinensis]
MPGSSRSVRYGEKNYEEQLMEWYHDASGSEVEDDDDEAILSEHSSDSEIDAASEDAADQLEIDSRREIEETENTTEENEASEEQIIPEKEFVKNFFGKNRYRWSSRETLSRSRTKSHNIVTQLPSLRVPYRAERATPKTVWSYLITEEILNEILLWTNSRLQKERVKYAEQTSMQDIDLVELNAFFGLLLYSAAFKSNHEHLDAIFATDGTGRDIFRCVMSKNRFASLLANLRFDDPETRTDRKKDDPAAPISFIFETFINNCRNVYSIGQCACVDEMLVKFRGRCKFKMYMPNKPAKYGIKLMCMTDARNGYLHNAYIYVGKDSDGKTLSDEERRTLLKPTQAVIRLTASLRNSNRNVTADNWFSSIELVDALKQRNLTYVGTMKKNKREVPAEFLPNKNKKVGSSMYGFTNSTTMLSYVTHKNKSVILVSSMHHEKGNDDCLPEIIEYYNSTKGGVDLLDQKCANYCCGRRTRRWPLAVFLQTFGYSLEQ